MSYSLPEETTFILSPWAIKPEKGDYWKMEGLCGSEEFGNKHNLEMSMPKQKIEFEPLLLWRPMGISSYNPILFAHRILFGPYDLEFAREMSIEEAKKRWPNTPVQEEEK